MISKKDWIKYFPHKKPRSQQVEAINTILNAYNSNKSYFALEAGTGVGKSAIAATVAQLLCPLGKTSLGTIQNHDNYH